MEQIVEKYLDNILKLNKLSHAYLFFSNNDAIITDSVLTFIKSIFCKNNKNKGMYYCNECKVCKQINNNNYIDFYVINSELSIKKDKITNLKNELSIKSSFGKKIYWIKEVDKLTLQAANTILKFLEEPEDNIIAILSTTNISSTLNTIISRCQVINLGNNEDHTIRNEENYDYISKILDDFLGKFTLNRNIAILNLLENISDKNSINLFLDIILERIRYNILNNVDLYKLYEITLLAKREINMNVNTTLILESFLFSIIKYNIDVGSIK